MTHLPLPARGMSSAPARGTPADAFDLPRGVQLDESAISLTADAAIVPEDSSAYEPQADASASADSKSSTGTPPRLRLAIEYSMPGDLRYLSHHDEMRMLQRTFARAAWPIAFTAGFNPQPRMTLPLPRNVGVAAARQLAIIELKQAAPLDMLHARLAAAMPAPAALLGVCGPLSVRTLHAVAVEFRYELSAPLDADALHSIQKFLSSSRCVVQREYGPNKPLRDIDIRPFVETIEPAPTSLHVRLRIEQQATARPTEVLEVLGLSGSPSVVGVERWSVDWQPALKDALERPTAESNP
ncbi:MAG: TIGR03936 family radical SAM-associated protein [Phycisphaerae bacterium]|nr:TIGR03936 family radical SAM-associated protein [Phycisphaerae bacterium]